MRLTILCIAFVVAAVSCGCSSSRPTKMEKSETPSPITSCKLSPSELAAKREQLIPGLFKRAQKIDDIKNGLRFHFASKPGLLTDLSKVMEQEQDCCSFLRFQLVVEPSEGPVVFEVTGLAGTGEMLRRL